LVQKVGFGSNDKKICKADIDEKRSVVGTSGDIG